jgi:hypothetical protein
MSRGVRNTNLIRLRAIDPVVRRRDHNPFARSRTNEADLNSGRESGPAEWLLGGGGGSTSEIEVGLNLDRAQTRQVWTLNAFVFNVHDAGGVGVAAPLIES